MAVEKQSVEAALARISVPEGGDLISRDMVRALMVQGGTVSFVIELPSEAHMAHAQPLKDIAERAVKDVPGVTSVRVGLSAPAANRAQSARPASGDQPPNLKIGKHPDPGQSKIEVPGVKRIIAIASGKGGVGKSTVSANLAVALARKGQKVGLLDADIYGPSQPMMFGASGRPSSPDGKTIIPLEAHGVTLMSIGFMVDPAKAVVWRGPMLMGALQQMLGQVQWGELDVLLVDLPPGTGDVQLTLGQKANLSGAIVVSTPQDVALIDARKAIDMFNTLNVPILGMIENMAVFHCPNCGHEAHVFGDGGVAIEAEGLGVPLLARLPIDLETRVGGDAGRPVALTDTDMAQAYAKLAEGLIAGGMA